jgi:hypothetical protein
MRRTAEAPRLITEVSERPGVEIFVWPDKAVTVDDAGFRVDGVADVGWSDVVGIARGYKTHPIAIAHWDFWAFRTREAKRGYWIRTGNLWTTAFSRAVRRRFPVAEAPPMKHWQDRDFLIRAYVVWPYENLGKPLYVPVKRRWWSWRNHLAYIDDAPLRANRDRCSR